MSEEKKEEVKQETKSKNKKLPIIITLIVVAVLIVAGIAGYFGYKYMKQKKTVGTEWGDTYYAYLKEAISKESNIEDYGLQEEMQNTQIQFIETEEKNPVMVMTYEKDNNKYVNLYKTNESENVDKVVYEEPATIEFLYNIENKTYEWYIHVETDEQDSYKSVNVILNNPNDNEADYTIKKGEETTQNTLSGDTITLSKYDEIFVKPEVDTGDKVDFSTDIEIGELRDNIESGVEEYKQQEKIVTEEVKAKTEEEVTKIEEKKESIEKAKEEIEQEEKRKEEERKAAEELSKGLQVGEVTLKYGKYVSDVSRMDSSMYGTIILKPNGKFHVKANCEGSYPYQTLDCDGTYKIDKIQNSFEYFDGLTFTTDTGVTFSLEAHSGGTLSDQWHGYTYVGNE